ncbi:hypothetical protein CHLRE_17g743307v5 [Chlamydomonas reinhardtii]|uniref:Uncharacterized protein n=1 Tax=Chlamydomonas reinhardtii TaxID=3055 RepID=A0A2K3CRW3_CHLRE|nr:uncharacterized protein CHLRE_17g743307v5 [Chlamydomonas reinhardtii]XP_042915150.1 uncharacterized protein CHLRE_17g743307v5 [Chlamydomonas reinhardtii]PNW71024.1 hypothetical protein CHLRE_17g743307v5 [Chlamydomonas reinhardtii]PNW71025.1 hypothetical protein CHLRE_17g743307v5 [Chlamydomonas reinhardtii]
MISLPRVAPVSVQQGSHRLLEGLGPVVAGPVEAFPERLKACVGWPPAPGHHYPGRRCCGVDIHWVLSGGRGWLPLVEKAFVSICEAHSRADCGFITGVSQAPGC